MVGGAQGGVVAWWWSTSGAQTHRMNGGENETRWCSYVVVELGVALRGRRSGDGPVLRG